MIWRSSNISAGAPALRGAETSLHRSAAVGGPDSRSKGEAPAHQAARRCAEPAAAAVRLSFSYTVPDRTAALRQGGAEAQANRRGALGGLPPALKPTRIRSRTRQMAAAPPAARMARRVLSRIYDGAVSCPA